MDKKVYATLLDLIQGFESGVASHTVDNVNKSITFVYLNGASDTITFDQPKDGKSAYEIAKDLGYTGTIEQWEASLHGKDGVSVTAVLVQQSTGHLMVTYSDGTIGDAGLIDAKAKLEQELVATVDIGVITSGKKYPAGTLMEQILRDMLIKVESPGITLSLTPATTVYDIVSDSLASVTLKAAVTKKTYAIKSVKFYAGTTLINEQDVTEGGAYSFAYTPATPIKATTTFKAVVEDQEGNSAQSEVKVSFVGKSYYGVVDATVGEPTEAQIKALTTTLKTVKGYVYKGITCDYNKVVYAYPADFGALTSIKDVDNNINYTNSFTRTTVKVDGINYYVYTQTKPSGADGVNLTFA